ncbi:SpdD protein [Streptomyces boncukensis]|uniref:SpdD protein n=1 Tax=Streptomyces boncukensis TaxID=2711219 RepID=A0A6G4X944_9ACTN|nr:SpdD protein [Streptomyces boncukensis]NGO74035.1 SpdD protein [Streptomyces boncukensis]
MLLQPKLPTTPHAPSPAVQHTHEPATCTCQHATPAPRRSPLVPSVGTGAVALVLVGGVVATALLAAVAVSAISVAVAAVVLRSLFNAQQRHR